MSCDIIVKETVKSEWVLPGDRDSARRNAGQGRWQKAPCALQTFSGSFWLRAGWFPNLHRQGRLFLFLEKGKVAKPAVVPLRGRYGTELMSARQLQFLFTFLSASESLPGESSPWREAKTNVRFLTIKFCPLLNSKPHCQKWKSPAR